ncbi:MAG TPA: hypothetical protein VJI67_02060 [archaeon]|nr:hypothetical protein [archaeon]HLD81111.1 hypothetical protein [archaeon]
MPKCAECGKAIGKNSVTYDNKEFDSSTCVSQYKEEHPAGNATSCEFC